MKRFINGKYVTVNSDQKPPATISSVTVKPGATVSMCVEVAGAGPKPNVSKGAMELMKAYPQVDFSGLVGTGKGGQVTKTDVEKFIKAVDAEHA